MAHPQVAQKLRDQVEEDKMEGTCSTNGEKRTHVGYWLESQMERDHYEDEDVGGWIILGCILER
jgi:hypothetical protein